MKPALDHSTALQTSPPDHQAMRCNLDRIIVHALPEHVVSQRNVSKAVGLSLQTYDGG